MHAEQQRENLDEVNKLFFRTGQSAHDFPETQTIRKHAQMRQSELPLLTQEAERRQRDSFLRFSYSKLCRHMIESFKSKSGPMYTTINNLLTIAELNFKERKGRCFTTWKKNFRYWNYQDMIKRAREKELMEARARVKKAVTVGHAFSAIGGMVLGLGNQADGDDVARDADGWPLEASHAFHQASYGRDIVERDQDGYPLEAAYGSPAALSHGEVLVQRDVEAIAYATGASGVWRGLGVGSGAFGMDTTGRIGLDTTGRFGMDATAASGLGMRAQRGLQGAGYGGHLTNGRLSPGLITGYNNYGSNSPSLMNTMNPSKYRKYGSESPSPEFTQSFKFKHDSGSPSPDFTQGLKFPTISSASPSPERRLT